MRFQSARCNKEKPARLEAGRAMFARQRDAAYGTVGERPRIRPKMAEITKRMIATKKIILAISTANPAMPPNPSTAAINATIKKSKPSQAWRCSSLRRVSRRQRPLKRKCSKFRAGNSSGYPALTRRKLPRGGAPCGKEFRWPGNWFRSDPDSRSRPSQWLGYRAGERTPGARPPDKATQGHQTVRRTSRAAGTPRSRTWRAALPATPGIRWRS